eukprot:CAMPEP_0174257286 /NCGR_PEP_ID=MMETSP0439-20130205/6451_1 /TAXON_ID=0 /ORGANISM="Stereomyxa ramosa, Strain Chinc5" /LENGTH=1199 /DNA_ID=CAMNT_0015340313 /DNA_START=327 /DNA_END=3926 /DNA_ORIENTATION=+
MKYSENKASSYLEKLLNGTPNLFCLNLAKFSGMEELSISYWLNSLKQTGYKNENLEYLYLPGWKEINDDSISSLVNAFPNVRKCSIAATCVTNSCELKWPNLEKVDISNCTKDYRPQVVPSVAPLTTPTYEPYEWKHLKFVAACGLVLPDGMSAYGMDPMALSVQQMPGAKLTGQQVKASDVLKFHEDNPGIIENGNVLIDGRHSFLHFAATCDSDVLHRVMSSFDIDVDIKNVSPLFNVTPNSIPFRDLLGLLAAPKRDPTAFLFPYSGSSAGYQLLHPMPMNFNLCTPLHFAVWSEKSDVVECLLSKYGANVDAQSSCGLTALMLAAYNINTKIMKILNRFNPTIHLVDNDNNTPLHYAISGARRGMGINVNDPKVKKMIKMLLGMGVDPTIKNKWGLNAPEAAAVSDVPFDVMLDCNLLVPELAQGVLHAMVTNKDQTSQVYQLQPALPQQHIPGQYPLYYGQTGQTAAHAHLNEHIATLIDMGADVTQKNEDGETLLISAVKNNIKITDVLTVPNISDNINDTDSNGWTALHHATLKQSACQCSDLISQPKININARTNTGLTPLMMSLFRLNLKTASIQAVEPDSPITNLLIENGASFTDEVNTTNKGWTMLHMCCAVFSSHIKDCLGTESEPGLDVNATDDYGVTPLIALFRAIATRRTDFADECVKILVENGAKVDLQDNLDGSSALHLMAKLPETCKTNYIKLVHEKDPDCIKYCCQLRDDKGRTPLDLSIDHANGNMAMYIISHLTEDELEGLSQYIWHFILDCALLLAYIPSQNGLRSVFPDYSKDNRFFSGKYSPFGYPMHPMNRFSSPIQRKKNNKKTYDNNNFPKWHEVSENIPCLYALPPNVHHNPYLQGTASLVDSLRLQDTASRFDSLYCTTIGIMTCLLENNVPLPQHCDKNNVPFLHKLCALLSLIEYGPEGPDTLQLHTKKRSMCASEVTSVISLIIKKYLDTIGKEEVRAVDKKGNTCLHILLKILAIAPRYFASTQTVQSQHGSDSHHPTYQHIATFLGCEMDYPTTLLEIITLLTEKGLNCETLNNNGESCLCLAEKIGRKDLFPETFTEEDAEMEFEEDEMEEYMQMEQNRAQFALKMRPIKRRRVASKSKEKKEIEEYQSLPYYPMPPPGLLNQNRSSSWAQFCTMYTPQNMSRLTNYISQTWSFAANPTGLPTPTLQFHPQHQQISSLFQNRNN